LCTSSIIITVDKEEDKMSREFSTYKIDENYIQIFWLENLKERNNLEDEGIDGNIVLKWILGR
jgi:hypothetical protein